MSFFLSCPRSIRSVLLPRGLPNSFFLFGLLATLLAIEVFAAPSLLAAETKTEPEEYTSTPYTEYGEFREKEDEIETLQFFHSGRFFGASIGLGYSGADGNRGQLWRGGFPLIDLKLHYWFDFDFSLQLFFQTTAHSYEIQNEPVGVNLIKAGVDLKYYLPTQDLSAALTYSHPHILVGIGSATKTESRTLDAEPNTDSSFFFELGLGLEFALKPRSSYFFLEGKYGFPNAFKDTYTSTYSAYGIDDLTGRLWSGVAGVLFTW